MSWLHVPASLNCRMFNEGLDYILTKLNMEVEVDNSLSQVIFFDQLWWNATCINASI